MEKWRHNGNGASITEPPEIPDHELLRCIGQGSYGDVWLARSLLGAFRAVKIVYRKRLGNEAPFNREFNGIKKFEPISRSHDGFIDILQVGSSEKAECFYYVMELGDDQETGQLIDPESYNSKTLSSELEKRGRF